MIGERFDYIVVGAGSAGSIIARRLVENSEARVLLLEAGGHDHHWQVRMPGAVRSAYNPKSRFNWHFETTPQPHLDNRRIYQPRGKGLGGSSSINGMVFLRGHPLDYEMWNQQGASGWSFAQVLPISNDWRTACAVQTNTVAVTARCPFVCMKTCRRYRKLSSTPAGKQGTPSPMM